MIQAIIIDDEQDSIETLKWKLENYCNDVEVIACFDNPSEGLQYLKQNTPDLVFLDIEMPRLTGFDLLEELGDPIGFEVIFTTAYDNFGIQAVKINAMDYLLKPIQNKELKIAINRFKQKQKSPPIPTNPNTPQTHPSRQGKVGLSSKDSIEFVDPSYIVLCMASSNYTTLFFADGSKRVISKTLKEFEQLLQPYHFYRVHHSHLVNLNAIKEFIKSDGGYLVMQNEMKIPVSKNRKDELLKLLSPV